MGCFFAGCCHGQVTDSVWGVVFHNYGSEPRIPTQLFEVVFDLILCFFMAVLYIREKFEYNMSLWMIGYGSFRFLIEHLRDEPTRMFIAEGFSVTMLVCILLVVGGVAYYFIMSPFVKRRKAYLLAYPNGEPAEKPAESDAKTNDTLSDEVKPDAVPDIDEEK
jgi:prolipoprotein diacylglyceryltransferase